MTAGPDITLSPCHLVSLSPCQPPSPRQTGPTTTADPDVVHVDGATIPLRDAVMPYTVPQNVAGLPSVTVPVALDGDGLPIGVQLTGRPWSEPFLISVAVELERCGATRSHTAPPPAREG